MMFMQVDLPEPDAPDNGDQLAGENLQRDPVKGAEGAGGRRGSP
jgi:hypothetical protein